MFVEYEDLPYELKSQIAMRDLLKGPIRIVAGPLSPKPQKNPQWHFEIGIEWIQDNIVETIAVKKLIGQYHAQLIGVTP